MRTFLARADSCTDRRQPHSENCGFFVFRLQEVSRLVPRKAKRHIRQRPPSKSLNPTKDQTSFPPFFSLNAAGPRAAKVREVCAASEGPNEPQRPTENGDREYEGRHFALPPFSYRKTCAVGKKSVAGMPIGSRRCGSSEPGFLPHHFSEYFE